MTERQPRSHVTKVRVISYSAARIQKQVKEIKGLRETRRIRNSVTVLGTLKKSDVWKLEETVQIRMGD